MSQSRKIKVMMLSTMIALGGLLANRVASG